MHISIACDELTQGNNLTSNTSVVEIFYNRDSLEFVFNCCLSCVSLKNILSSTFSSSSGTGHSDWCDTSIFCKKEHF